MFNNSLKDKLFTGVLPADNLSLLLKALEETFNIHIIEKNKNWRQAGFYDAL